MNADFTPSPGFPADDPVSERRRALLDRQLERLDQLIDAGMGMVQSLAAQASGAGPRVVEGDLILAYSRAARAVRMAILLQSHLAAEPDAKPDDQRTSVSAAGPEPETAIADPAPPRDERIEALEESPDRPEGADEKPERAPREYAERLERDDIYRLVRTRPVGELIIEIANDLGLAPDWPEDMPLEPCAHDEFAGEDFGAALPPPRSGGRGTIGRRADGGGGEPRASP